VVSGVLNHADGGATMLVRFHVDKMSSAHVYLRMSKVHDVVDLDQVLITC